MAASLRCVFSASNGKDLSMTFPYADTACGDAQVKSLMQAIVTNKEIYAEQPLSIVGAEFVVRQTIDVDLS